MLFDLIVSRLRGCWCKSYIVEHYFRGLKILDAGCGMGDSISLAPRRVFGIDTNPDCLKKCKSQGFSVKRGDVCKIPYQNESFDAIICFQVIEHLTPEQAWKALKEFSRVLKPGGRIAISTPMNTHEVWNTFTHIRPYPPKAFKKMTEDTYGQETYPKIRNLKVIDVMYSSSGIIKTILSNILPIYRYGHTTTLQKTGGKN